MNVSFHDPSAITPSNSHLETKQVPRDVKMTWIASKDCFSLASRIWLQHQQHPAATFLIWRKSQKISCCGWWSTFLTPPSSFHWFSSVQSRCAHQMVRIKPLPWVAIWRRSIETSGMQSAAVGYTPVWSITRCTLDFWNSLCYQKMINIQDSQQNYLRLFLTSNLPDIHVIMNNNDRLWWSLCI